jgi:fructokinase
MTTLVIGEALIDILDGPDGAEEVPGGSGANTAIALSRLGGAVRLATALGDDARGARLRAWLEESDVMVEATPIERTSTAHAVFASDGSASYTFDLTWQIGIESAPAASAVHTGSLAAAVEPGAAVVEEFLRRAAATATISIDPNIRPAIVGEEKRERLMRFLELADVIKLSDEDLGWLAPGLSPLAAASRMLSAGAAVVVVTRGARGSLGFARGGNVASDAVRATVIDTVGAGDTFTAALLDTLEREGLLGAERREHLRSIGPDTLGRVLNRAGHAAALTVSRRGANPPTREQLQSELR